MKTRDTTVRMILFAACAVLLLGLCSRDAASDELRLVVEPYLPDAWIDNGYDASALVTYQIYAQFSQDGEVVAVFGNADASLTIASTDGLFHNAPEGLDRVTAPFDLTSVGIWENQWDSYVTIGTDRAEGNQMWFGAGTYQVLNDLVGDFTCDNCAWIVTPAVTDQGVAECGRVQLAQFTVAAGESIFGVLNVQTGDFVYQTGLVFDTRTQPWIADASRDGVVAIDDLLIVLAEWGPYVGCRGGDVTNDGTVDVEDLLFVLATWGQSVAGP